MAITTWAVADAPAFTSSVLSSTFLQDVNTKLVNIGLIRSSATGQLDETNPGTLTSPVNTGGGGISGAVYYAPMIYTFPTGSGAEPTVSGGAITAEPYDSTPCVLKLFFGWYRCESNTASTAFATICKIQVGLSIDGTGAWTSNWVSYNSAYPLMSAGASGGVTQTFRSTNSYLQNTGKNFFFMLCPDMVQHGSDVTYSAGMASSSLVFISIHRDNGSLFFIFPPDDTSNQTTTTPTPRDIGTAVITSTTIKNPVAISSSANGSNFTYYSSASVWPRFGGTTAAATISSAIIYQPCWYLDVNGVVSSFNCNSTYMNSAVTKATITGANVTYPSGTVQRNYLHLGLLNTVYYTANASSYALAILYE